MRRARTCGGACAQVTKPASNRPNNQTISKSVISRRSSCLSPPPPFFPPFPAPPPRGTPGFSPTVVRRSYREILPAMSSLDDVALTRGTGGAGETGDNGDTGDARDLGTVGDAHDAPDTSDAPEKVNAAVASAPLMPSVTAPDISDLPDNLNDTPRDIASPDISRDDKPKVEHEAIVADIAKASSMPPLAEVAASPPESVPAPVHPSEPLSVPAPTPGSNSALEPPAVPWGEAQTEDPSHPEDHVEARTPTAPQVQLSTIRGEGGQTMYPSMSPVPLPAHLGVNPVVEPEPTPEPRPTSQPDGEITTSTEQLSDATTAAIASLRESLLPDHQSPQHAPQSTRQPYNQQTEQQQVDQFHEQHRQQQLGEESISHQEEQLPQYDGLASTQLPAATVAQHGLQALQAAPTATSPTSDHLAQQYAQSATLQMNAHHYAEAVNNVIGNGNHASPQGLHMHPNSHTFHQSADHNHLPGPHYSPNPVLPVPHGSPNGVSGQHKVTRLRRACDMCSQRKVKCDESGPPCKPCSDLNVECTFERQMKRRGPPNKHAEAARAAKRHRVDESGAPVNSLSPQDSQQNGHSTLDAEAIAPWPVLELLVDDFFTYIHPLMPFPHEPTFRQAFAARADRTSTRFLALLSSMIGVLVASFPRSARNHLKSQHSADLFPTSVTMIERCRDIALQARGSLFMANEEMTAEDAATSYFLGLSAAYILRWKPCKRFMAETMTFVREVSVHRRRNSTLEPSNAEPTSVFHPPGNKPVDHIKDQMTKRIFWVIMAGIRYGDSYPVDLLSAAINTTLGP